MNNDTIFALSSGHGKAGVAVIRISGNPLSIINYQLSITPRRATLIDLLGDDGALIDRCIAIYFQSPHSFTGEDVIELHTHGSVAVIEKVFEFLRTRGARMANPGEFSRRAFYNNKMDLPEVDGLAALLDARTDRQRAAALKSMTGGDSKIYENWRAQMIEIAAYAAAMLDYPADELPANIGERLLRQTQKLHDEIDDAISRYGTVKSMRGGFNIVLAGKTNVGKSSLFNRLVGAGRAIVSDIPGTTRDVVSAQLDIDGYLVNLSDTAGLRESSDEIEKIGIEKTHAEIENADLVLNVQCSSSQVQLEPKHNEIIIINKSDLLDSNCTLHFANCTLVSAATGDGVPELLELIKQKIHSAMDGSESDIAVNERTQEHLRFAANELAISKEQIANIDIFAEHARRAANEIGKILGVINTSDVMDATFGQLCLGK